MLDPLWNLEKDRFLWNWPFDCCKISWGLKKKKQKKKTLSELILSDWPGPPPPPDKNSWIRACTGWCNCLTQVAKLGKSLQGDATYQISRLYAMWFQTRIFFPLYKPMKTCDLNNLNKIRRGQLDEATYQITLALCLVVSESQFHFKNLFLANLT